MGLVREASGAIWQPVDDQLEQTAAWCGIATSYSADWRADDQELHCSAMVRIEQSRTSNSGIDGDLVLERCASSIGVFLCLQIILRQCMHF